MMAMLGWIGAAKKSEQSRFLKENALATKNTSHANRRHAQEREVRAISYQLMMAALAGKLTLLDGKMTAQEKGAFAKLFPDASEERINQLLEDAAKDGVGHKHYAKRLHGYFKDDNAFLKRVVTDLFAIALADGYLKPEEILFLRDVHLAFGFTDKQFDRLLERYVSTKKKDAYAVLGLDKRAERADIKYAYRAAMSLYHPDRLMAMVEYPGIYAVLQQRVTTVQDAYNLLKKKHKF